MEPENPELADRLKPIVDEAAEKYLGVSIDKLSDDITSRLTRTSMFEFDIDTGLPYQEAKKSFKKAFLTRLLVFSLGNISEVARITGKDRRSIHRLVRQFNINVRKIKRDLVRPYDVKVSSMNVLIEDVLDKYRTILHPERLREFYENVPLLSEEIVKEMPQPRITLKEALAEFDVLYFRKTLQQNAMNISRTARQIGIRYETLSRKLRSLGMM